MLRSILLTVFTVVWTAVLLLVGGRFLALLIGANRDSSLIDRLYSWSEFLVEPFFNVLNMTNQGVEGGGTFEPASLFAFLLYLIIGLLAGTLLSGAFLRRTTSHA